VTRAGGLCELRHVGPCSGPLHRHHRLARVHGGTHEVDNLLLVCQHHHAVIHANPEWSYGEGWLVRGVA
jgi:hypothetical protein